MDQPGQGDHGENTRRQSAGDGQGMEAGLYEQGCFPFQTILHCVIDAASRHQGKHSDNQGTGGRFFCQSGDNLRIYGQSQGGNKVLHDFLLHAAQS